MNFKEKGNEALKNNDILGAINFYTKAIAEDDSESIFFSNRAICYFNLKEFDKAMDDSQSAIEIDEKNIKAQYVMAKCQLMRAQSISDLGLVQKGVRRLRNAHGMCRSQKKDKFEKDIQKTIYRANKLVFIIKERIRLKKLEEFYSEAMNKISNDKNLKESEKNRKIQLLDKYIDRDRYNYEIPDYFICELSKNLMLNPVITKHGNTYEKDPLLAFVHQNGIDPKNNKPLNRMEVYPNLAIKDAMEEFLRDNAWAYEFESKSSLFNNLIQF